MTETTSAPEEDATATAPTPGTGPLSQRVLDATRDVAEQGDRWFLAAVHGLDRGVGLGSASARKLAGRFSQRWKKLRASRWSSEAARRRIRKAVLAEARRAELDTSNEDFRAFTENVATLVELVLTGAIRLHDVGFAFEDASDEGVGPADDSTRLSAQPAEEAPP